VDYVNEGRLRETLAEDRAAFRTAEPFPHLVLDGFLRDEVAAALEAGFPAVDHQVWKHHLHLNAHKFACNRIEAAPPLFQSVLAELNSRPLLSYLEELTGIQGLIPDAGFEGGGLHQITPGGYLKVHADFNHHPLTGHHRRLNLLVYLNRGWQEPWDGNLELWSRDMSRCVRSIVPALNRAVLFGTTDFAYHGHPRPLACPPGQSRKSLALYYYTQDRPAAERSRPHSTLYRRTPAEPIALNRLRLLGRTLLSGSGGDLFRTARRKLLGR
jgi:hypothetical protein